MKEKNYYFPHDINAKNDGKMQKLIFEMGSEGYGIYWYLIESMYENKGTLELSNIEMYANALRTKCERITNVIQKYNLFNSNDIEFWSESCRERLGFINKKCEKARKSVKVRWDKYERNTNVILYKEKKSKEKNIKEDINKSNTTVSYKSEKSVESPKPLEEYEVETKLQKCICSWKQILGFEFSDRRWDKLNFARTAKTVKRLLEFFEDDHSRVITCMEDVSEMLKKKKLDFSIETIEKYAAEWDQSHVVVGVN